MKRIHASSINSAKRVYDNNEVSHRSVPTNQQMNHHYLQTNSTAQLQQRSNTMMEFVPKTEKIEQHDVLIPKTTRIFAQQQQQQQQQQQHLIPHHMAHSSRGVSLNQTSVSVNLKRPSSDDDINDENLAVKRTPLEENRPPLTRGESLPATSFPPERQNFKEKHPVSRAPSFDAAFSGGGGVGVAGKLKSKKIVSNSPHKYFPKTQLF